MPTAEQTIAVLGMPFSASARTATEDPHRKHSPRASTANARPTHPLSARRAAQAEAAWERAVGADVRTDHKAEPWEDCDA